MLSVKHKQPLASKICYINRDEITSQTHTILLFWQICFSIYFGISPGLKSVTKGQILDDRKSHQTVWIWGHNVFQESVLLIFAKRVNYVLNLFLLPALYESYNLKPTLTSIRLFADVNFLPSSALCFSCSLPLTCS